MQFLSDAIYLQKNVEVLGWEFWQFKTFLYHMFLLCIVRQMFGIHFSWFIVFIILYSATLYNLFQEEKKEEKLKNIDI